MHALMITVVLMFLFHSTGASYKAECKVFARGLFRAYGIWVCCAGLRLQFPFLDKPGIMSKVTLF